MILLMRTIIYRIATLVLAGMVGTAAAAPPQTRDGDLWQLPSAVAPALGQVTPAGSCESLLGTRPSADATVREAVLVPTKKGTGDACRVTIDVTVPLAHNPITVWLTLPTQNWNGRFLGLGGFVWLPGFTPALNAGTSLGFATAITNAGRPYDVSLPPEEQVQLIGRNDFLLDANGRLDWTALQNFAYRGIHEMTVVGKAVAKEFYGKPPRYAYFSGCSTGGRQGQSEMQRYPQDYDGIVSGAPAINWAHFAAAEFWQAALKTELGEVPQCKLNAAYQAAVAACDGDDGARDGLVSDAGTCRFDAKALVGLKTECGAMDAREADIIGRIWEGPRRRDGSRLWSGIDRAAVIVPPQSPANWATPFFDGKAPDADGLSFAQFEAVFDQLIERYGPVMDTASPNVGAFAKRGKAIIWHGIADDIIPVAGTVHYVESIRRTLGEQETDRFLRFYLAPGVQHCRLGDGPQPVALLESLMAWVEQGRAPNAVRSENWDEVGRVTRTRPLCPYPQRARYRGRGSLDDADSFQCQK
jgi:hypothetical protein